MADAPDGRDPHPQNRPQLVVSSSLSGISSYTGQTCPKEWFTRFEEIARARSWAEDSFSRIVVQFFEGQALFAYRQLSAAQQADWAQLKQNICTTFATITTPGTGSVALYQGLSDVQTFAFKLTQAVQGDFPTTASFTNEAQNMLLKSIFLSNVNLDIRFQLVMKGIPDTMQEVIHLARQIEANLGVGVKSSSSTSYSTAAPVQVSQLGLLSRLDRLEKSLSELSAQMRSGNSPKGKAKKGKNLFCNFCRKNGHEVEDCKLLSY